MLNADLQSRTSPVGHWEHSCQRVVKRNLLMRNLQTPVHLWGCGVSAHSVAAIEIFWLSRWDSSREEELVMLVLQYPTATHGSLENCLFYSWSCNIFRLVPALTFATQPSGSAQWLVSSLWPSVIHTFMDHDEFEKSSSFQRVPTIRVKPEVQFCGQSDLDTIRQ